uniref:DUF3276 family protein n=1 Tax=Alistipes sp. TaxID=1872444 RepID=UPI0040571FAE
MDIKNHHRPSGFREGCLLSKAIRAGRRTYFFDVHSTRGGDDYIVITESRKHTSTSGELLFDRHRIFLYKEDFGKFAKGLEEVVSYVYERHPDYFGQTADPVAEQEFETL